MGRISYRSGRGSDKHRSNKNKKLSYLALSILSSSGIMPLSTCFTKSHLTAPGVMASISSNTGRLVLISGSCPDWGRVKKKNCKKHSAVFSQPQTQTHTRTLKLLICVLFFFSARVVLTQLRMM